MALVNSKQLRKPISGSFTGSFAGDGSGLTSVIALIAPRIASGSATASISPVDGFVVNISTLISGSLTITGSVFTKGTLFITGSNNNTLFLIKNNSNQNIFEVKQNGIINVATQSVIPFAISASAGDIYFTSSSMYIGLE
jgi:hypothetical protein